MRPSTLDRLWVCAASLLLAPAPSLSQSDPPPAAPPSAPVRVVVDDYYGTRISDPYRYMEDLKNSEVQAWFKAQDNYTRDILSRIPGRDALLKRISELDNATLARVYDYRRLPGERYFYQKRLASEDVGKIYVRDGLRGTERVLIDPAKITPAGSPSFVINYYTTSFDGSKVVYGASPGGSEDAVLHIVDVATGRESPETIDRGWFAGPSFLPDGKSFVYNRMQKMTAGMSPNDRELKSKIYLHVIGTDPEKDRAIFGYGLSPRVKVEPTDITQAFVSPIEPYVFGMLFHGTQNEFTMYVAPISSLTSADIPWRKLFDTDDAVTAWDVRGDNLFLTTHKDAPRFKVILTSLTHPDIAHARTIIPESQAVVRVGGAAADAFYVLLLDGGIGRIERVPISGSKVGAPEMLTLPIAGNVWIDAVDVRLKGLLLGITSWNRAPSDFAYDPSTNRITDTGLQPLGPYDAPQDIVAEEVKATSYDGTQVPLSIVHRRDIALDGTHPTLLEGYGAYGITLDPFFDPKFVAWFEKGGVLAIAHARGGGEYGQAWYEAGKGPTKHNTWRDFIACAQYLVDHNYTTPANLAGEGGSAGGITIGRAITERPDLFAAAIDAVGVTDALRAEESPNGAPNVIEFGSTKTKAGYDALYEMSSYHHVKDGTAYPAVLVVTGINDPRVAPWEPGKMAARLQAATSSGKPVLLRVDYEAGHGFGSTKTQTQQLLADEWSFLLWQLGVSGFQPMH